MIHLKDIEEYVNKYYDLEIRTVSRVNKFVDARSLYYKLAREFTTESYASIGKFIGKHHASVLHAMRVSVHYIDKKDIDKAYLFFGKESDLPEDSYSFIEFKNKELKKELERKNTILGLVPKLETFYTIYEDLIIDRQEKIANMNNIQFQTIDRCLSRLNEIVDLEQKQQYHYLNN